MTENSIEKRVEHTQKELDFVEIICEEVALFERGSRATLGWHIKRALSDMYIEQALFETICAAMAKWNNTPSSALNHQSCSRYITDAIISEIFQLRKPTRTTPTTEGL